MKEAANHHMGAVLPELSCFKWQGRKIRHYRFSSLVIRGRVSIIVEGTVIFVVGNKVLSNTRRLLTMRI